MSDKKCCVPSCVGGVESHSILHKFPNPAHERDRFNSWVYAIGGDILRLPNKLIYKYRRVCHAHFASNFVYPLTNRLSKAAIPTLNMPDHLSIQKRTLTEQPLMEIQNITVPCLPSTSTTKNPLTTQKLTLAERPLMEIQNITVPCLPSTSTTKNSRDKELDKENNSNKTKVKLTCEYTLRRNKFKKPTFLKSPEEQKLYKKLLSMRIKLSKCKNKSRKRATALKMAMKTIANPCHLGVIEELPTAARVITLMQLRESKKKNKGHRFTLQEKITALAIYKQSPKCYRFLRKLLVLPAQNTLIKLIQKADIKPGINKKVFEQLKTSVEKMKKIEHRLSILLFDEMALMANTSFNERKDKVTGFTSTGPTNIEYADHAQVFMVRGLQKNYKQPISYTFAKSATKGPELARQIKEIIGELQKTGLIVVATVCDQGTNNRSAINSLLKNSNSHRLREGLQPEKNNFFVNNQEIIPLFDTPHLMKCVRNNLITKNFKYDFGEGGKEAKWEHLELLHKENPGYKGIRLIPKLTDYHVIKNNIPKMKVKYATQIFSETVAKNMGYLADKRILPEECKETADMLLFFDKLFDSVNGSYGKNKKHYGKPLLGSVKPNSIHHEFWNDAKKKLRSIKCVDHLGKTVNVPTFENWAWTLDGLEILLKKIHKKYSVNSVWMRHINQDPLENFFGTIRSHGCRNNNPTPAAFESAFTALLINNLSGVHASKGNCEEDYCQTLHALIVPDDVCETPTVSCQINDIPNVIFTPIENKQDPKIKAPLEYVSGYFISKLQNKVFKNCGHCKNIFIAKDDNEYIKWREYFHSSGHRWLHYPSDAFVKLISELQDIYSEILKHYIMVDNIQMFLKTMVLLCADLNFVHECKNHADDSINFLITICNRFFIHNYCKNINRILRGLKDVDDNEDINQVQAKNHFSKCSKRKR